MNKRPKIALVSNTSWSIYNFRLGLIRSLKKKGYEVVAIAPKDNFTSKLISENIAFEEIQLNNYGTNPITELRIVFQLARIYNRLNPDLIFHYTIKPNIYGSIAAKYVKIPSIAITTGLGRLFHFKNPFISNITIGLYRMASKCSKEIWFLNDNDRDVFVYKNIVDKSKTKVINSEGINTSWFKPKNKKDFNNISFLFAGRLIWDKGIQEYIETAQYFKSNNYNIEFNILGFINQENPNAVPYTKIMEWQSKGLIKYLGETTDIRVHLENSSCLVFPSYYREGVSRILMEAASMETPIITTNNVGCKNIVDHRRNGYVVNPKNTNELIQAVKQFLSLDDNDMYVMGKLGRKKMIREFEESMIIQEYHNTLKKYINIDALTNPKIYIQ